MSAFEEIGLSVESRETDRPVIREADTPRLFHNTELRESPFSDSSLDIFESAFKAFALTDNESEKETVDANGDNKKEESSNCPEKADDGKYYDKETGKAYDSIEAWKKAQETLAKRYEGTAKFYEEKANKEWARFKNAEQNGESEEEKWEHYRKANEYYDKAKECKEKADKVKEKISATSDSEKSNEDRNDQIQDNGSENSEVNAPIQNKVDGLAREKEVSEELKKKYPPEKGYEIISEVYLRDKNGKIVRDPETGEARRIDFVVVKDGKVVDSVEVTSKTADKTAQSAKENRIRDAGGNYIRDNNGNLIKIPSDTQTRIERRD